MKDTKTNKQTEQITIKNETQKRFIIVYESVYKNTNLSANELALIIKLLSLAPNFKPNFTKLMQLLGIGKKALLKASKGLQEKGYLIVNVNGKNSEWIIKQEPIKPLKDYQNETILNALINGDLNIFDVKRFYQFKYIDKNQLIYITETYAQELKEILQTKWLND